MAYTGSDKDGGVGYVTNAEETRVRDVLVDYATQKFRAVRRYLGR